MDHDWTRLGAELRSAREARGLGQAAVGDKIGVKRGAMRNIENGALTKVTPTVRAYARAVGWRDDAIEAVLAGGSPTYVSSEASESRDARAARNLAGPSEELPLRIQAALAEGPLIDTAVINLPGDEDEGPDGQMVVIIKGRNNATPEQIKRALLRWEEAEAQLRRTEGDTGSKQD